MGFFNRKKKQKETETEIDYTYLYEAQLIMIDMCKTYYLLEE